MMSLFRKKPDPVLSELQRILASNQLTNELLQQQNAQVSVLVSMLAGAVASMKQAEVDSREAIDKLGAIGEALEYDMNEKKRKASLIGKFGPG